MAGETLSVNNTSTSNNGVGDVDLADAAAALDPATDRSLVGDYGIIGRYAITDTRKVRGVETPVFSDALKQELADLYRAWADPGMIPPHEDWHSTNGSGGTQGPGSGEKFLMFHEQMLSDFLHNEVIAKGSAALKKALTYKGEVRLPRLDFTKPIPDQFFVEGNGISSREINYKTPDFLERKAVQGKNGKDGETFTLDGKEITCLEDIETLDDLGRVIGESGAHAVGHVELGGQMGSFDSVAVAAFLLWHGWVVEVTQEWLKTDNGKAWSPAASRSMDNAMMHHNMDTMEVAPSNMLADAEAAADRAAEMAEKAQTAMEAGDANAEALAEEARSMLEGAELALAKAREAAEKKNVSLNESSDWSADVGTVAEEEAEFKEAFTSSMEKAAQVAIDRQTTATGATEEPQE